MLPATPTPQGDRLALLLHLTQVFNSTLDLDEVLNRVMDEVITVLHAERGFVVLKNAAGGLEFRVARGLDQTTIDQPQFQVSRSVVEQVAASGQAVLTSDAQADERFNLRQSVMILGLRSILCVPLKVKDQVIGAIYADNRLQAGIFTHADLELLITIASSAAIAVENARLYRLAVENARLEQELQMARRVQQSLLPREMPSLEGWEFAVHWKPAREVGGDYYDFITLPDGCLGVVIADVTDKSLGAALFVAFARSIVRANLDHAASPAEGIRRANELICQESNEGLFVTLFYAMLDPATGQLTYVNAGHNPPVLCRAGDAAGFGGEQRPERLTGTGIPLGVDGDSEYSERTIYLRQGDFLILYTDGATEAMNQQDEMFGLERLEHAAKKHCRGSAGDILESLEGMIYDFTSPRLPFDDLTLMVIRRI